MTSARRGNARAGAGRPRGSRGRGRGVRGGRGAASAATPSVTPTPGQSPTQSESGIGDSRAVSPSAELLGEKALRKREKTDYHEASSSEFEEEMQSEVQTPAMGTMTPALDSFDGDLDMADGESTVFDETSAAASPMPEEGIMTPGGTRGRGRGRVLGSSSAAASRGGYRGRGRGKKRNYNGPRGPGSRGGKGAYANRGRGSKPVYVKRYHDDAEIEERLKKMGNDYTFSIKDNLIQTSIDCEKDWSQMIELQRMRYRALPMLEEMTIAAMQARQNQLKTQYFELSQKLVDQNYEFAGQSYKQMRAAKEEDIKNTDWYQQVHTDLDQRLVDNQKKAADKSEMLRRNSEVFADRQCDGWRGSFGGKLMEEMEFFMKGVVHQNIPFNTIKAFHDPYLNYFICVCCDREDIDDVTDEDLLDMFGPQIIAPARNVYDLGQPVCRSNKGVYDPRILQTEASKLREKIGTVLSRELENLIEEVQYEGGDVQGLGWSEGEMQRGVNAGREPTGLRMDYRVSTGDMKSAKEVEAAEALGGLRFSTFSFVASISEAGNDSTAEQSPAPSYHDTTIEADDDNDSLATDEEIIWPLPRSSDGLANILRAMESEGTTSLDASPSHDNTSTLSRVNPFNPSTGAPISPTPVSFRIRPNLEMLPDSDTPQHLTADSFSAQPRETSSTTPDPFSDPPKKKRGRPKGSYAEKNDSQITFKLQGYQGTMVPKVPGKNNKRKKEGTERQGKKPRVTAPADLGEPRTSIAIPLPTPRREEETELHPGILADILSGGVPGIERFGLAPPVENGVLPMMQMGTQQAPFLIDHRTFPFYLGNGQYSRMPEEVRRCWVNREDVVLPPGPAGQIVGNPFMAPGFPGPQPQPQPPPMT